jgi:predicted N-formylglutamate amidohydrolase
VAERLAERFGSTLVWQRYSRLVVDCNRQPHSPGAMVEIADGTVVPGNRGLGATARTARLREIHAPYHDAITSALDERQALGLATIVVSLHSFTPRLLARPTERPWPVALCWGRDDRFARRVHAALVAETAGLLVGQNEPYTVDMVEDYTIPVHGEGRGLAYVEIEVRQDQLGDAAGQAGWADRLAVALSRAVEGFARVRGEG